MFRYFRKPQINQAFPVQSTPHVPKRVFELPVGTLVIAVGNEWDDMMIGTIVSYDKHHIPTIHDWMTDTAWYSFACMEQFSKARFYQLLPLNPYERYNLLAKYSSVELDKPKSGATQFTTQDYLNRVLPKLAEFSRVSFDALVKK